MKIRIDELRTKMLSTLQHFSPSDAERIVEVLLWADMSGVNTHGVIRLTGTLPLQNITPTAEISVQRESPVSMLLDAGANPAPLVAQVATDHAIAKANTHGISIVAMHNVHTSTGAQGFYAERIAAAGLIGIVQSRAGATTAGFGSIDPLFGTNPIAFSFPTLHAPLIFDMSTSAMTWYGLVLAQAQGKDIPEGLAIDADGNITTDPVKAMQGALLPFGADHKGAGMALVVELLGGVLAGSEYGEVEGDWGSTFIDVDPDLLIGRGEFARRCSHLVDKIKTSRLAADAEGIRLPGERGTACRKASEESGAVEVDETILKVLGYIEA